METMPKAKQRLFPVGVGHTCLSLAGILLLSSFALNIWAQKIGKPGGPKPGPPPGPKIGKKMPKKAPDSQPPGKPIIIRPNEGYLALATTSNATVSLMRLVTRRDRNDYQVSLNGVLNVPRLKPGSYRLEIRCDDYEPFTDTINIIKGEQTVLNLPLTAKYGTVMFGFGAQATRDIAVWLDGKEIASAKLRFEKDTLDITRVPVGLRQIRLSKPGYEDWSQQIEVKPGAVADNKISVAMIPATITLTVKSLPQADVYIDGLLRGGVGNDGALLIPDLEPGAHTLKVKLAGYQGVDRSLSLTIEKRAVTEVVNLISILETSEFNAGFKEDTKNWVKTWPQGWELTATPQRGLQVTGERVGLINNTTIPNQPFNHYGDFLLLLNVKFVNGKGAAWVVRAQDDKSYYLFELATSQSKSREKAWNFYICRDGNCMLKDSQPCLAEIEKPESHIRISLEARGNSFTLKIPSQGDRGAGPTFTDDTFRYGGIGLRTINSLEMFVTEFFIKPTVL